jgi:hypothetical protein
MFPMVSLFIKLWVRKPRAPPNLRSFHVYTDWNLLCACDGTDSANLTTNQDLTGYP